MLQIPEQEAAAGLGSRWLTAHISAATSRKAPSPENGLSNLQPEFLGWQSSGGIDLDHATFKGLAKPYFLRLIEGEIPRLVG